MSREMPVSAHHHHALLVDDLDRATAFYGQAFGGRALTGVIDADERTTRMVMGGPAGTRMRLRIVGFDEGAVELFEFVGPGPQWALPGTDQRLPHFALVVDDVGAALAAVERAGGRRVWPQPLPWGEAQVVYVRDPDGNLIELLDAPLERIAHIARCMFPDSGADGPEVSP